MSDQTEWEESIQDKCGYDTDPTADDADGSESELYEDELQELFHYYGKQKEPASQENLVALLREIQDLLGYVPEDVQERVSTALNIKTSLIRNIIKLYPSLTSAPKRHQITLCLGPRCSAKQASALFRTLRIAIRRRPFSLTTKICLKQCRTAPNLKIDGVLYPSIRPEDVEEILQQYESRF